MKKLFLVALILLWLVPVSAHAQNTTCATRLPGDNSNACASTAFVHGGFQPTLPNFTSNNPLIGNGTNVPVQGTRQGTTTIFPTIDGTSTSGQCAVFDASGGFTSTPCTSSGSGNVSAGIVGNLAVYTASTTVAGAGLFYANIACNGSTDVTTVLNTALTAATGGVLILPTGVCVVTTGITVPLGTTLMGQGQLATTLKTSSTTGDVMTLTGNNRITSLGFDSSVTRTAGNYIAAANTAQSVWLDNLFFNAGYNDITLLNPISTLNVVEGQNETPDVTAPGSTMLTVNTGGEVSAVNLFHRSDASSANMNFASILLLNGSMVCSGCELLQGKHALVDEPGTGQLTFFRGTTSHFDTTYGDTIDVTPSGTGLVSELSLSNVWIAPSANAAGVNIAPGASANVQLVQITGSTFRTYTPGFSDAVLITKTALDSVTLSGDIFGTTGGGFATAVGIAGGVGNFSVTDSTSLSCTNSIFVATGASQSYIITNNMRGSCGPVFDGGSGTFKTVSGNP